MVAPGRAVYHHDQKRIFKQVIDAVGGSDENPMSAQTKSISYNCLDGCRGHQAWLDSGNTSVGWSVGNCRNLSISIDRQTIKEAPHPKTFINDVASDTFKPTTLV